MKRTKTVSRELFIKELERPMPAKILATTLAIGEESGGGWVTTLAIGEEALKGK
ncbi:MAG: hypothetical protein JXR94_01155 [Candidatus Hydrogenedentes bacterium]|nr:hypothetical protein [Candidatus Hydrogenedentota bacterium]